VLRKYEWRERLMNAHPPTQAPESFDIVNIHTCVVLADIPKRFGRHCGREETKPMTLGKLHPTAFEIRQIVCTNDARDRAVATHRHHIVNHFIDEGIVRLFSASISSKMMRHGSNSSTCSGSSSSFSREIRIGGPPRISSRVSSCVSSEMR